MDGSVYNYNFLFLFFQKHWLNILIYTFSKIFSKIFPQIEYFHSDYPSSYLTCNCCPRFNFHQILPNWILFLFHRINVCLDLLTCVLLFISNFLFLVLISFLLKRILDIFYVKVIDSIDLYWFVWKCFSYCSLSLNDSYKILHWVLLALNRSYFFTVFRLLWLL